MEQSWETLKILFEQYIAAPLMNFGWTNFVDIAVLAVLFFMIYSFARVRRAGKLAFGLFLIMLLYFITEVFELHATQRILSGIASSGIVILAIIFQPELRSALEKLGNSVVDLRSGLAKNHTTMVNTVSAVVDAACAIAQHEHDGALIVIESSTRLGDNSENGTKLDALVSANLLKGIFIDKAPLHDGAVIIRGDRIIAAGCKLPVLESGEAAEGLGTRHRAALKISEISDCVAVVVSEETHIISLCNNGNLKRDYNPNGMDDLKNDESLKAVQNRLRSELYLLLTGLNVDNVDEQIEKNEEKEKEARYKKVKIKWFRNREKHKVDSSIRRGRKLKAKKMTPKNDSNQAES